MTHSEALDRLLAAYSGYYNINRETPAAPFAAEAVFNLHDEQFFLIRSAKISEADTREFVFFALADTLDMETFRRLDSAAWETGLSRVELTRNHRNTDVNLFILARHIPEEVKREVRKTRHYKSYRFGLRGWSSGRLIACDLTERTAVHNARGDNLLQVVKSTLFSK